MQGRFEDAERHFSEALRISTRTGARPWIAYTEIDYAGTLLDRHGPGDRDRASQFIGSALETALALKMNNLGRRAKLLKERLESAPLKPLVAEERGPTQLAIEHLQHDAANSEIELTVTSSAVTVYAAVEAAERHDGTGQTNANIFKRESDFWTIVFDHKVLRLKHAKGLSMIAWLLRHPRHEFLALTLEWLAAGRFAPDAEPIAARLARELPSRTGMDDSGPLLDGQARAAYRQRLEELRENLAEAKSFNDIGKISQIEQEIDFLESELCRAVGLGGRTRKWPSATERARVNVANAVRAVLAKLRRENPELARYFSNTIKTGRFCSFEPDPLVPAEWLTDAIIHS
jgi:tetratricopeptide (TPR) repeat protein